MRTYVPQRYRDDCSIAAMAMFAGRSYETIVRTLRGFHPDYKDGGCLGVSAMLAVLSTVDEPVAHSHFRIVDRPTILCVFAPSEPSIGHALYWDGSKAWDPADPSGETVTDLWIETKTYAAIQRVRDLVELIPASRIRSAGDLEPLTLPGELAPGERR